MVGTCRVHVVVDLGVVHARIGAVDEQVEGIVVELEVAAVGFGERAPRLDGGVVGVSVIPLAAVVAPGLAYIGISHVLVDVVCAYSVGVGDVDDIGGGDEVVVEQVVVLVELQRRRAYESRCEERFLVCGQTVVFAFGDGGARVHGLAGAVIGVCHLRLGYVGTLHLGLVAQCGTLLGGYGVVVVPHSARYNLSF